MFEKNKSKYIDIDCNNIYNYRKSITYKRCNVCSHSVRNEKKELLCHVYKSDVGEDNVCDEFKSIIE